MEPASLLRNVFQEGDKGLESAREGKKLHFEHKLQLWKSHVF